MLRGNSTNVLVIFLKDVEKDVEKLPKHHPRVMFWVVKVCYSDNVKKSRKVFNTKLTLKCVNKKT